MRNILVTDFDDSGEDIVIFSETHTPETVKAILTKKQKSFNEIYEVPSSDLQYYLYEACHLEIKN